MLLGYKIQGYFTDHRNGDATFIKVSSIEDQELTYFTPVRAEFRPIFNQRIKISS